MDIHVGDWIMVGVFMGVAKEDSIPMDTGKHSVLIDLDFDNPVGHTIALVSRVDDEYVTVNQWDHDEGAMIDAQIDRLMILQVRHPQLVASN